MIDTRRVADALRRWAFALRGAEEVFEAASRAIAIRERLSIRGGGPSLTRARALLSDIASARQRAWFFDSARRHRLELAALSIASEALVDGDISEAFDDAARVSLDLSGRTR